MTYNDEELNLIVISSLHEIGDRAKRKLCNCDPQEREEFIRLLPSGVQKIVRDKLGDNDFRRNLEEEYNRRGIECVTYISDAYPESLKNIPDPPSVLYCKGNVSLLKTNCFSIVGSRRTPSASLALCKKISGEITQAFTVVTGMAEGADAAAIEGALASGKLISVLPNGFDCIYPSVHKQLIERVAKEGLLVSEYLPSVEALKYNFPARNRIIAGLCRGVLVVSAGQKSGALITADYALEFGREIFAFPYNIGISSGVGCNKLIKNGAYLTENILDIFDVFGLDLEKPQENIELTDDEREVLEQIKQAGEVFLPTLAQKINKFTYQLLPIVSSLEIKGLITRLGGNRYGIIRGN